MAQATLVAQISGAKTEQVRLEAELSVLSSKLNDAQSRVQVSQKCDCDESESKNKKKNKTESKDGEKKDGEKKEKEGPNGDKAGRPVDKP